MTRAYLDHNATTPIRPEVLDTMLPYLKESYGNPNSVHALGQQARAAVEAARAQVAALLNADPEEIVFTSCGSESDVLAIAGAAQRAWLASSGERRHVVVSAVEHEAVRQLTTGMRQRGFDISIVPVDGTARVDPAAVRAAIKPSTAVVSVMHANNEVGTIQPIREIAAICKERGTLFHTDAVQSAGKLAVDVRELGADLASISGHKINAPKGIGALYVRKGVALSSIVTGNQEKNRRGGTENVAGIAALGKACELARKEREQHVRELSALRARLEKGCLKHGGRVNGHPTERLPGTCHVSFEGIDGHALVIALDLEGVCASAGSACSSGAAEPSHVLKAMGLSQDWAAGSVRFSLGWGNTAEDVDRTIEILGPAVEKLRKAVVNSKC
ncbi:MAG: cysteine desulfurase [Elusimicrobia bacterium]|nr:cysteine desulfurase [Elusimicrobiota bacterium]